MSRKKRRATAPKQSLPEARSRKEPTAATGQGPLETLDAEWARRRSGARNVAGVRYQIAVTAYVLVAARCGLVPIVSVAPEGFEDIDCELSDGDVLFLQCKERGEGTASIGPAEALAVFSRSEVLARNAIPGLVTDAEFAGGISETGWDGRLSNVLGTEELSDLFGRLPNTSPQRLVTEARVIRLPWHVSHETTEILAQEFGIPAAVAAIVVAELLEELTKVAADQRKRDRRAPLRRRPADVDRIVEAVKEITDMAALDTAVRLGYVELVDFSGQPADTQEQFLRGVDVEPHHIAAGYDLPRPTELEAIHDGIATARVALVVGPSGSGKSALVWRAALDIPGGARTYRVRQLTDQSAPDVIRFVRLQRPSEWSPVLVCVDDLGRPNTAAWQTAARQLLEIPHVALLAGVRQEDFEPNQALGRALVVEPSLDDQLARAIDRTLEGRGVERRLDPLEAYKQSNNLLMEYLALLIGGERLELTIDAQVQERVKDPDRATELELMRLVCLGHTLGAPVDADALHTLVPRYDFTQALERLREEHVLTISGGTAWTGLHELRSEVIARASHRNPPPREVVTAAALVRVVPPASSAHLMVQVARRFRDDCSEVIEEYRSLVQATPRPADLCELIRGALLAEAVLWAQAALEAARKYSVTALDDFNKVSLAYGLSRTGDTSLPLDPQILLFAKRFPLPPRQLRSEVVGEVVTNEAANALLSGTGEDAAQILESIVGAAKVQDVHARAIWNAHEAADLTVRGRIARALVDLAPGGAVSLGNIEERIEALRAGIPTLVDGPQFDPQRGSVTLRFLVFDPANANDEVVGICRSVLSFIPEAELVEAIGLDADGEPYAPGGHEMAHKRLTPKALPAAGQIDLGVAMLDAARRGEALTSWTQRLRLQTQLSHELIEMLGEAAEPFLNPYFYDKRKRDWRKRLEGLVADAARLPAPPLEALDRTTKDPAQKGLDLASGALRRLADMPAAQPAMLRGNAVMLRKAGLELRAARSDMYPTLSTVGDPMPASLIERVELIANLLLVLADSPPWPPAVGSTWLDRAADVVSRARSDAEAREADWIHGIAADYEYELIRTQRATDDPWFMNDQLLVVFPADHAGVLETVVAKIEGDVRESLMFRTYLAVQYRGAVVPGIGFRVGNTVDYPLDTDALEQVVGLAGRQLARSPSHEAISRELDRLSLASRWASLGRLRRETDGPARDSAAALLAETGADADLSPRTRDVLQALKEIVEDEVAGSTESLAAETAKYVRTMTPNDATRLFGVAAVSALDDDIENGRLIAPPAA